MKIDEKLYIGKRFGSMTILRFYGRYRNGECQFVCKCDCGTEFYAIMRENRKIKQSCDNCRNKNSIKYWFDYNGEKVSVADISRKCGLSKQCLRDRLVRLKMTVEEAINYQRHHVDTNETRKRWRMNNADKLRANARRWRERNPNYGKNYYYKYRDDILRKFRERYAMKKKEKNNDKASNN